MPSLKEIKGRIASVNSTRKITSAMKMVASSKLHHAQVAIQNMLPYETLLEHILKSFLAAEADSQTIYDQERPVHRVALVVFSSNSSLCGGFNANIIKRMQQVVAEYREQGVEGVEVYLVHNVHLGVESVLAFLGASHRTAQHLCLELGQRFRFGFRFDGLGRLFFGLGVCLVGNALLFFSGFLRLCGLFAFGSGEVLDNHFVAIVAGFVVVAGVGGFNDDTATGADFDSVSIFFHLPFGLERGG